MIKELMKSIGKYKKNTILAPLYVTCEVIMEGIIPYLMASLIDLGIDQSNMNYILRIGMALIISAFISLIFGVLAGKHAAIASAGYAGNLRKNMFDIIQGFSFSNVDKFSSYSLITRLTTDVTNVQNAYQMIVRLAFRSPVMIAFSMIMSFRISAELSLVFLLCIPILGGGLYFIMTRAHPIFERVFKIYDRLNMVVQENLRGIRVVKSFVREDHENKKFQSISEDIYHDFSKAEKLLAFNMPLMQFCMYGCMLLISWFGARLIVGSGGDQSIGMSTGQLMSLMTYVMQILTSLMMLSMVVVTITMSRASAERIVEILEEESDLKNPLNPVYEVKDGSVVFENVDFAYSSKEEKLDDESYSPPKLCLQNINITIGSGETIGIIGGTGSAKTSLVQLIPRLFDTIAGRVLVGGKDVKNYDIETLRNEVAIVLQKNVLFSGTLKENLRWGNENASDEELLQACSFAQAHDFIENFPEKYNTYIEQGGSNVSGGQKQRICIARALLKKPKILILDDSTSAVDTKTDEMIRRALREEIPHMTKIIIAQTIRSVENADQIIVMDKGKINGIGTHEELLATNLIYQEVYNSQKKGAKDNE